MDHRLPGPNSNIAENIKQAKEKVIQVYDMLPNFCSNEEIPELLDDLRSVMKDYVLLDTKYKDLKTSKQKVIQLCTEKVKKDIAEGRESSVAFDEINELLKNTLRNEMEKHHEGFLEKDPLYITMKNFGEDEINNAEDQAMNNEDDLAVTGETIQTIDPYSKKEFSDPVKNLNCKHTYEREIIMGLIATNSKTRCYWMGCNNRVAIRAEHLVSDDELKRYINRLKTRAAI
ncbi:E3 SUMO-protein ligase NSE2-like [Daphnia pulex]|uniref:E3 SUMO-protein ligase NSE2-like n=1 Tax=Daphnia pulex TaxID=6669 RepID=UPI001EDD71FB|nr:E3 SUMO-protein ligase NSE2-like [Daphnia pulex]XP_046645290.1 E3 SUMO-protein ligase NSE2-like [Daphnia pulicaria]XP_046645291.1 E3 SUMO-protein ligase NSE2-like [Daphnia pulicaria]